MIPQKQGWARERPLDSPKGSPAWIKSYGDLAPGTGSQELLLLRCLWSPGAGHPHPKAGELLWGVTGGNAKPLAWMGHEEK